MASSDDEVDVLPKFVSDYYFVEENDEPISFSVLPLHWSSDEISAGKRKQVFVHGTTDNGLQRIYKPVTAWKFDLSRMNPEILVLSKDHNWIKLQKPKKNFESIIRTTLITVNCLHLLKKNPEMSDKLLWNQLSKNFSFLEPRPSVNDLIDQMNLIEDAFRRDQSLSKSKFVAAFLEERPRKKNAVEEDGPRQSMKGFIIDDDAAASDDDDDDDEEDQLFDSVCSICDNGGRITPCEGICMRSFHTTSEDANKDAEEDEIEEVSICSSLNYPTKEIRAKTPFSCKNCIHKQHQCFCCGRLGSSDKSSGVAEVFQCVSAACGYFYHPRCVAKLLHQDDEAAAEELAKNIAAGVSFTCPSHHCCVCKQLENHMVHELQFAVCRRCPTSYHRKCLPRDISFEGTEDIEQRAWENLLHINNRILIYCLKHKIDPDLGTPIRNHLKFPGEECQKQKPSSALLLKENKLEYEKKHLVPEIKRLKQAVPDMSIAKSSHLVQEGQTNGKIARRSLVPIKRKTDGTVSSGEQPVKKKTKRSVGSSLGENKESLGKQLWEKCFKQSDSENQSKLSSEDESDKALKTVPEKSVILKDELDPDSKKRIEDLFKEAESSITSESIYEKYNKLLSTHVKSHKSLLDSLDQYTQGRVERLVQAIQNALQKLDAGCNVKEAEAICAPTHLNKTIKIKNKLRVYLAPFLHGMRYTSFGRHFTKVDKLKEIVEKIHWYVEDDDTVVDFCCGANDFSSLMKDKLEQTGKECSYRNFDLFQPKNDFCFERKDWFKVKPSELPRGSKLVMGLNPPFGVNASLANKFIDKALEFKPKLIVLIVPKETERLDQKNSPYDLVWEDFENLSGKSFYLPGSIDINDKQIEDWNVTTPVLSLWSRRDCTSKFKEIAKQHGHVSGKQSVVHRKTETTVPDQSIEASVQASDMEIDPPESEEEKKLGEIIEELVASTKDCVPSTKDDVVSTKDCVASTKDRVEKSSQHKAIAESHGVNARGSAESAKNVQNKQQRKKNHVAGKVESRPLGGDHQRQGRPPGKPYYNKPDHSPSSDMVYSRSPPEDQSHVNRRPPSARGNANSGIDHIDRSGFSGPVYQYPPRYLPGRSGYLEDNLPRRYDIESENAHLLGHGGWHPGERHPFDGHPDYMRDGFGQRPFNSEMGSRWASPPPNFRPPPPSYGQAGGMSAMERYAPRLDGSSYPRMGNVGPPDMPMPGHSAMYNYQAPRPPFGGVPMGFAPGPRAPSDAHQRLGGWLND